MISGMQAECIRICLANGPSVSGLLAAPVDARAMLVFAHGAGAGMTHSFMEAVAQALAERRVATLRFNFPFMEFLSGKRWGRPDPPAVAHAAIRAAAAYAHERASGLPLFVGGKSFGARMTSEAQAQTPIENARGLILVGFPLHPAKKPSTSRGDHLSQVRAPMLFLQGARDALADVSLMAEVCGKLPTATLQVIESADHSFAAPVRSGRTQQQIIEEISETIAHWIRLHA